MAKAIHDLKNRQCLQGLNNSIHCFNRSLFYCHPQVTKHHQSGAPGYGLCQSTARPKSQRRWRAKPRESSADTAGSNGWFNGWICPNAAGYPQRNHQLYLWPAARGVQGAHDTNSLPGSKCPGHQTSWALHQRPRWLIGKGNPENSCGTMWQSALMQTQNYFYYVTTRWKTNQPSALVFVSWCVHLNL